MSTPAVTPLPLPACGCSDRLVPVGTDPSGHDFVTHNDCALTAGVATVCTRCHRWAGRAGSKCPADGEEHEVAAYTVFRIDCGGCGDVIELDDADPFGEVFTCDCGARNRVTSVP